MNFTGSFFVARLRKQLLKLGLNSNERQTKSVSVSHAVAHASWSVTGPIAFPSSPPIALLGMMAKTGPSPSEQSTGATINTFYNLVGKTLDTNVIKVGTCSISSLKC